MLLSDQDFLSIIKFTPLVSIDLLLKNSDDEYLLGRRLNKPAKDFWFVPGGRIQKLEKMQDAFKRLVNEELDFDYNMSDAKFLGPWEHFYSENFFNKENVDTHYIVLAHELDFDLAISKLPKKQHSLFKWFSVPQLVNNQMVHINTRRYFQ